MDEKQIVTAIERLVRVAEKMDARLAALEKSVTAAPAGEPMRKLVTGDDLRKIAESRGEVIASITKSVDAIEAMSSRIEALASSPMPPKCAAASYTSRN